MAQRPTIVDVARTAGVSKSTVSLVLQRSPLVRAETRDRVLGAMAELGYVYNRTAARLRDPGVGLIGLVNNDLRNPFFIDYTTAIQSALRDRGFAGVAANTDEDPGHQAEVVEALIGHGVSALVLCSAYGDTSATLDLLDRTGLPTVQVLRRFSERTEHFPFFAPDFTTGGRLATEHLLAEGADRIVFAGGLENLNVTRERRAGYAAAMSAAGRAPSYLSGPGTRAYGRALAEELATSHPDVDAVVCFNDLIALGFLAGCARLGRTVGPAGIRIVGCDDIEPASETWPSLSSIRCDVRGFGDLVAAAILDWLLEGRRPPPVTRMDVELVPRASSVWT